MATAFNPRRAGARRGRLAPAVRDALRAEVRRIAGLDTPVVAIREVGNTFAALDSELERLADVRRDAVAALRAEGRSYDWIANATGLSKARVAQLVRETRARRRQPPDPHA